MASRSVFLRRLGRRRQRWFLRHRRLVHAWLLAALVAGVFYSWKLPAYFPSTTYHGRAQLAGDVVIRPLVGRGVVYDGRVMVVPVSPLSTPAGRWQEFLLRAAPMTAPGVFEVGVSYAGRWAAPDRRVRAGWRYGVVAEHGECGARGAAQADVHAFGVTRSTIEVAPCAAPLR